ncbi:CopL family metal-binding regulatory protein [Stenotrophomonas acidaminiphila]|uniref:CopL family metal-binding regulatory protein n=1 Tax=Stenotrophomonas acidaminiphila TaxID=128780 RepID=UPI0028AD4DDD|nr:CopL family metal-binding regulatory protein [Stenotrophomonas acidaminiphila]
MPAVSAPTLLLRLLLIVVLVLNGAWSAFASVSVSPAGGNQATFAATAAVEGNEDCVAHHSQVPHTGDAKALDEIGGVHGDQDHAGPDCCKSSACRCACVHACASALPTYLYVSVQLALGLHVRPLPLGHTAPALPHLIRPPIG